MKWLLAIIASLSIIGVGRAQSLIDVASPNTAWNCLSTNMVVNTITNANPTSVATLNVGGGLYHTFQLYGTNGFSYCIARSIDNTNWFVGTTNAVTANVVAETTITGKYLYMQVRLQGTNINGGFNYLSGR